MGQLEKRACCVGRCKRARRQGAHAARRAEVREGEHGERAGLLFALYGKARHDRHAEAELGEALQRAPGRGASRSSTAEAPALA